MKRKWIAYILLIIYSLQLYSCKLYNQNILFKTPTEINITPIEEMLQQTEQNYIIQPNDYLTFQLFTNQGEIILEPPILTLQQNVGSDYAPNNNNLANNRAFLVEKDGNVRMPMLGSVHLEGYTLKQADSLLAQKFATYYKEPFVRTNYENKRVIVFRGNSAAIVPLRNEGMNLIEILASSGGFDNTQRASNIRIIRGDLKNPNVYIIDLTTIDGVKKANLLVQPNDIIYVEPIRKTFLERISDVSPILGFVTTILTFILLIQTTNR
ncbi:MAG: polysaccharide export protein EpsE [Cytophagales bacterium]|nr:MAG: polysaccharide export protein EpsE [Cytophagales bacterium]